MDCANLRTALKSDFIYNYGISRSRTFPFLFTSLVFSLNLYLLRFRTSRGNLTITSSKTIVLGDFANTNFGDGGRMPSHFPFCFTKDKPQRVTNDHDKSRHFYFHFADRDLYGAISAGFAVDQAFVVLHMQSRHFKSERGMPIKNVGSLTRFPHAQLRNDIGTSSNLADYRSPRHHTDT